MSLTQDRNTAMRGPGIIGVPVAAGAHIYAGALVVANAAGFAAPGSTAVGLAYLGRADVAIDNTAGAAGAQTVTVRRGEAFKFANSSVDPVTQASVGRLAYIVDDQTVAATSATNTRSPAGVVLGIEPDGVWIQ
jgi:hypothetical protein